MWVDNASKVDLLFYKPYADVILKILSDDKLTPITIGLFGSWGAGKSTLLNFIDQKIIDKKDSAFRCININAWLLEGYDDAKAAVIEAVLKEIESSLEVDKKAIEADKTMFKRAKNKICNILKKVNWLKVGGFLAKKTIATAVSLATMNPLPIAVSVASNVTDMAKTVEGLEKVQEKYLNKQTEKSAAKTIREIRKEFTELLAESNIKNLVVTIDDLDRCLPERIIETLEAVKLFLSVEKSTFIFAVDGSIIRYAIRKQYPLSEDNSLDIAKDYIEKIIQIPITIPEMSSKDIQNYLLLLIVEKFLSDSDMAKFMKTVETEHFLTHTTPMAISQIAEIIYENNITVAHQAEMNKELAIIDGIRSVVSSSLKGNPRQSKRFLNTFSIKRELSELYFGDAIDVKVLAKLLALYIIDEKRFIEIREWFQQYDGDVERLRKLVECAEKDETLDAPWSENKLKKWLLAEPKDIYIKDLSNYFYLTRDLCGVQTEYESLLNDSEKKLVGKILETASVNLKGCVNTLNNDVGIRKDVIKGTIISKYESGLINLDKISIFFIEYADIRDEIIAVILKRVGDISLSSVPHIKLMYSKDPSKMKVVVDKIKDDKIKQMILGNIGGNK